MIRRFRVKINSLFLGIPFRGAAPPCFHIRQIEHTYTAKYRELEAFLRKYHMYYRDFTDLVRAPPFCLQVELVYRPTFVLLRYIPPTLSEVAGGGFGDSATIASKEITLFALVV